jgi:hypothetical protein
MEVRPMTQTISVSVDKVPTQKMYNEMDISMRAMVTISATEKTTCVNHHMKVVMLAAMGIDGYRI